jgi:7-carboxy-7-deazaguanine synthase
VNTTLIPVAETFGPTLQGEGQLAGRSTYFLRVGGCDFACVWCDSRYAVLPEEVRGLPRLTAGEITASLLALKAQKPGPEWLTITGGNPALYELGDLVLAWQLHENGKVAVETQGSRWKDWFGQVDLLTISPKPPSSAMVNSWDFNTFMTKATSLNLAVALKAVVFDEKDYTFARHVHLQYPEVPFYLSCGTASGGLSGEWAPPLYGDAIMVIKSGGVVDSKAELLNRYRWLAERAMNDPEMADVAVFPQLHALAWGITTRGV